jgi:N-acetylmuramic acid 6-phosphate etherase
VTGEVSLGHLSTEAVRPGGLDLETMSTPLLVGMMADDVADVQQALVAATDSIAAAIDQIAERLRVGGRLMQGKYSP